MRRIALAGIALAIAFPGSATAGDAQERAAGLSTRIMSPFCPGLTLHDCPTQEADELRAQIVRWAGTGMSDDAIFARLEDEYGPGLRAVPGDENAWLIWAIPGMALAAGIVLATFIARRWTRAAETDGADPRWATSSPHERERLEEELRAAKRNLWGRT